MRNVPVIASVLLAIGMSCQATAQDSASSTQAMSAPTITLAPTCELHIFPTLEGQAQTTGWLAGFGVVGAIADAAAHKDGNISNAEYLKSSLGPENQVIALKTIDVPAALKLPAGTRVIYETPIADRGITTKAKTRLTSSIAPCYAELLVTQNFYIKRAIYGRSLNNRFIFKDFRNGKSATELNKGRGGNKLSQFPPESVAERPAADADLRSAFSKNFLEYARSN